MHFKTVIYLSIIYLFENQSIIWQLIENNI